MIKLINYFLASIKKNLPASVSSICLLSRLNNLVPNSVSNNCICFVTAVCDIYRLCAALVKFILGDGGI